MCRHRWRWSRKKAYRSGTASLHTDIEEQQKTVQISTDGWYGGTASWRLKTAVLKILHAYMYDPFYELPKGIHYTHSHIGLYVSFKHTQSVAI